MEWVRGLGERVRAWSRGIDEFGESEQRFSGFWLRALAGSSLAVGLFVGGRYESVGDLREALVERSTIAGIAFLLVIVLFAWSGQFRGFLAGTMRLLSTAVALVVPMTALVAAAFAQLSPENMNGIGQDMPWRWAAFSVAAGALLTALWHLLRRAYDADQGSSRPPVAGVDHRAESRQDRLAMVVAVGAAVGAIVVLVTSVDRLSADQWAALAAWVTVAVAVAAAVLALRQLREAQDLRIQQAKPYVVAFMESESALPEAVKVVIHNFGLTAAHDVRLEINPPLRRSTNGGGVEDVWLPDIIKTLAPGQRWQTQWDIGHRRAKVPDLLDDRHDVQVHFLDPNRNPPHPETTQSVLDWAEYMGRRWVVVYTTHHAAEAIRKIEKQMRSWTVLGRDGLHVWTRDGDREERRRRKADKKWERKMRELEAATEKPANPVDSPDDPGEPA